VVVTTSWNPYGVACNAIPTVWRTIRRRGWPGTTVCVCVCVCVSVWNDCYVTNTDSGLFLSRWTVHVHQRKWSQLLQITSGGYSYRIIRHQRGFRQATLILLAAGLISQKASNEHRRKTTCVCYILYSLHTSTFSRWTARQVLRSYQLYWEQ